MIYHVTPNRYEEVEIEEVSEEEFALRLRENQIRADDVYFRGERIEFEVITTVVTKEKRP